MSDNKCSPPKNDHAVCSSVVSIAPWRQQALRSALNGVDDRRRATVVASPVVNFSDYRTSLRASAAYYAALEEFARIAKHCRQRRGLSVEEVAEQTEIPPERLRSMEEAEAAIAWPEMLMLAPIYRIQLSEVCQRLKQAFERLAGVDAYEIEQQLQFRPESPSRMKLSSLEREGIMKKLLLAMGDNTLDSTIASWPSFLLPTLGDSIRGECVSILIQLQSINECLARCGGPGGSASSKVHRTPGCGAASSRPLSDISYVELAGIAASLQWHLTRHFYEPRRYSVRTTRSESASPWRSTMESAELELKRQQVSLHEAVALLVPFTSCGGTAEAITLTDWSDTPLVFPGHFEPMHIEDALCQSALQLVLAAKRLAEVAKRLP